MKKELGIEPEDAKTPTIIYLGDKELERYRSEIQLVLHYIHEHYVNHITLHDLAAHVCLNESYLSRLFKIETKKTLNRYLNEIVHIFVQSNSRDNME